MIASFGGVNLDCDDVACGVRAPVIDGAALRCGVGLKFAGLGAMKGESMEEKSSEDGRDGRAPS